jgi:NitT/TauT family transport system substrate-binding protein
MLLVKKLVFVSLSILSVSFSGCGDGTPVSNQSESADDSIAVGVAKQVAVQLNWYPEAEHGGVYQAEVEGLYTRVGMNVEIRPGGRATPVAPELQLGRVQFAFANADDVVIYRRQGLDVVAVAAAMQDSPRCILVQEASGVESFDGLAGMTLQRQAGRPFLDFMRGKGILDQVKEVPYQGSVASLVADKGIAIQAYSFAEPLLAEQQGVAVRRLMVSDLGWNPYASVIITTGKLIKEQPQLVRDFVQASCAGWRSYLADPSLGNQAILEANEHGMTSEALEYGVKELRPLVTPEGIALEQIGMMTLERWEGLVQQMDAISPAEAGKVDAKDCFNASFLGDFE